MQGKLLAKANTEEGDVSFNPLAEARGNSEDKGNSIKLQVVDELPLVLPLALASGKIYDNCIGFSQTEETGQQLLKRIKAEKQKLVDEKKIKKDKELAPIKPEEIPFEIPESWVWCRMGEIVKLSRGRFSIRPRNDPGYFGTKYPFIQIGSLDEKGSIINDAPQALNEKGYKVSKEFPKGTIAIAIVGGTIGNLGVLGVPMCFTDSIIGIIPSELHNQEFVLNYLRFVQPEIKKAAYQMAGQPNIKIPTLTELIIPLPPLSEQNRIVKKLEELMKYCDELEKSIGESKVQNERLLQRVLKDALSEK